MKKTETPIRTTTERKNLPYTFKDDELLVIAKKAAEEQNKLRALEDARKMVADEWKAKISASQSEITNLTNKVSTGIEYRDLECTVTFDSPIRGQKTITRPDTGEIVIIKEMTRGEVDLCSQTVLPLEVAED